MVPALGAQQGVQLVQHHGGLDPDQQVEYPEGFVEQELAEEREREIRCKKRVATKSRLEL